MMSITIRKKQQGFTLIEVIVALVIIAFALPALMSSITNELGNLSHVKEKSIAQWVASNKLVELQLLNRLEGGVPKGKGSGQVEMAGFNWEWRSDVKEFEQEMLKGIFAVEIKVYAEGATADDSIIDGEASPLVTHYGMMFDRNKQGVRNLAQFCANPPPNIPYCRNSEQE